MKFNTNTLRIIKCTECDYLQHIKCPYKCTCNVTGIMLHNNNNSTHFCLKLIILIILHCILLFFSTSQVFKIIPQYEYYNVCMCHETNEMLLNNICVQIADRMIRKTSPLTWSIKGGQTGFKSPAELFGGLFDIFACFLYFCTLLLY